jgi:lipopolysaccharide/colanic/teichoic acid biosynthesis glycosyltransferase
MPSSEGSDADVKIERETTMPLDRGLTVFDGADENEPETPSRRLAPGAAAGLDAVAAIVALLAGLLAGLSVLLLLPDNGLLQVGLAALAIGGAVLLLLRAIATHCTHTRVALLGDARSAHDLAWRLAGERRERFTVVGFVTPEAGRDGLREIRQISFNVRRLGLLADLSRIVARNDIDLLVMAGGEGRLDAFERAAICNDRYGTRLISLAAFEEAVFRRVDLDQLDAAWFQHLMHPSFRPASRLVSRAIEITFALTAGLLTLPLWAPAWLLVRATFGKPALVTSRRVGEQGRAIALHRFRVAPPEVTGAPAAETAPPTGLGRLLRRSGVERLPVLIDLLRGELALVGPRAIHPHELATRERELRFYGRRQLLRPGLTGWARIRGATEPDEEFSADLYYLKHQSLSLMAYVLLRSLKPKPPAGLLAK